MILSLQKFPVIRLMQGLRLRPATARTAPGAKVQKPAVVPHWIDFLNQDADTAQR